MKWFNHQEILNNHFKNTSAFYVFLSYDVVLYLDFLGYPCYGKEITIPVKLYTVTQSNILHLQQGTKFIEHVKNIF